VVDPGVFLQLQKFAKLSLSDVTISEVQELAQTFGYQLDVELADNVITLLRNEDDQALLDWVFNAGNLERFKSALVKHKAAQTILTACPHCDKITVKPVMAVAAVEPHIVCNHCKQVIELSAT
jgi:GH24 family phage-related lysozyme (muramidase)